MLQIRPTEIKAVAALLMQEHEEVDVLAREVIELIDSLRAKRDLYVAIAYHPTLNLMQAIGPYATENQALKDGPAKLQAYDTQSKGFLAKLRDPSNIDLGS